MLFLSDCTWFRDNSCTICNCSGETYNCSNFSTHAQGQRWFEYSVSVARVDIHALDGDDNEVTCESSA